MGSVDAFMRLSQDIPSWIRKLDDLSEQVAKQSRRCNRLSNFPDRQLFKRRTGSTESLRPKEDVEDATTVPDGHTSHTSASSEPQSHGCPRTPQHDQDRALEVKTSPRKRKPASSLFATSGPTKYRTKSMIIVYYDSAIQEGFESLVRSIASSRNAVRKAKLEAGYKARLASLGMEGSPFPAGGEFGLLDARGFRPRLERKAVNADLLKEEVLIPAVDIIEKELEKAQSLCETAAHQYLREGQCDGELTGSRESFQKCLDVSDREVKRLLEVKDIVVTQNGAKAEKSEKITTRGSFDTSEKPEHSAEKSFPRPSMVDAIEIDDGLETDDVQVDLTAFRRTRAV